ncbi:MAG: transglycosylase SLT domain-containing protein [Chloroherpetonaceae bacterium]|nr:transglycosylase SLT domain-containing protein [Chloroherpetonaceae bacterium]
MHRHTLLAALCTYLLCLAWCSCTSTNTAVYLPPPEETALEPAPIDTVKIKYLDSLRRAEALARQQQLEAVRQAEMRQQKKDRATKLARIKLLAELAEKQKKERSENLPSTLTEGIELIAELLDDESLERDATFCWMAFRMLQLYDEYVMPLSEADTDNPALAIRERLLGNAENTVIDESLFIGMLLPKTQIPIELNAEVKKFITYFSKNAKMHIIFQRYLDRAAIYFPTMAQVLAEEGVPPELIYLSIVESGVNPHARSRANAIGMWQFVKGTGRLYGLEGNLWFDERRDVIKSTRSAARHLKDLYQIYGDWYLALAAYNAGGGRVNRALKKSPKKRDFWSLCKYFRRETRQYVPRYLAATLIAMNPTRFGFTPIEYGAPIEYDEVSIPDCISLSTIADYSGIPLDSLRFLNPELHKNITPPAYRGYKLKVPKGRAADVASAVERIPASERLYFLAHKAKRDESLLTLAKQHRVSPEALRQFNELKTWHVPKGRVVIIPTTAEVFQTVQYSVRDLSDDSREARYRPRWRRRYAYKKRKSRSTAQQHRPVPLPFALTSPSSRAGLREWLCA